MDIIIKILLYDIEIHAIAGLPAGNSNLWQLTDIPTYDLISPA